MLRSSIRAPRLTPILSLSASSWASTSSPAFVEERKELALLYRILSSLGWTHSIFNHISARVPLTPSSSGYLLHPFGMEYSMVTPDSLLLVDEEGRVVVPPTPPRGPHGDAFDLDLSFSRAAFGLHSALHAARPDVGVIIHVHTVVGGVVGAVSDAILPLCQEALILGAPVGNVGFHPYGGIVLDGDSDEAVKERTALADSLGPTAKALVLQNHGLVSLGRDIPEALHFMFNLIHACNVQASALAAVGGDTSKLSLIPDTDNLYKRVFDTANSGGGGVVSVPGTPPPRNGLLEWKARAAAYAHDRAASCSDCTVYGDSSCICSAIPGTL